MPAQNSLVMTTRSTISHCTTNDSIQTDIQNFHEAWLMLIVLNCGRGAPNEEKSPSVHDKADPQELYNLKLKRDFARSFAYLCSYAKTGPLVTALALAETRQSVTYCFASNRSPPVGSTTEPNVEHFLQKVLTLLRAIRLDSSHSVKKQILDLSITHNEFRIKKYIDILEPLVNRLKKGKFQLHMWRDKGLLLNYLHDLKHKMKSAKGICQFANRYINSIAVQLLNFGPKNNEDIAEVFKNVRHNVSQLRYTVEAVEGLVRAGLKLPELFKNFRVVRVESPLPLSPTLRIEDLDLYEMFDRMICGRKDGKLLNESFRRLPHFFKLQGRLKGAVNSMTHNPTVHAELILLEAFQSGKFKFLDGDRYIGCSKPACYFCYQYMEVDQDRIVLPATHHKAYPNCQLPCFDGTTLTGNVGRRLLQLKEMTEKIREDVIQQIRDRRGPTTVRRADSWSAASTNRARRGVGQAVRVGSRISALAHELGT